MKVYSSNFISMFIISSFGLTFFEIATRIDMTKNCFSYLNGTCTRSKQLSYENLFDMIPAHEDDNEEVTV